MSKVKSIILSLLGLMFALILLQVGLRLAKKVPVVGAIAGDAQNLTQTGTISGS